MTCKHVCCNRNNEETSVNALDIRIVPSEDSQSDIWDAIHQKLLEMVDEGEIEGDLNITVKLNGKAQEIRIGNPRFDVTISGVRGFDKFDAIDRVMGCVDGRRYNTPLAYYEDIDAEER